MSKHVYIQAIALEKDTQTGDMVVRAITNQGRFVIGIESLDEGIVGNFYSWVKDIAVKEVEKALAAEAASKSPEALKDQLKEQLEKKVSS